MNRKDILRRLEERLARGEISEKTYIEIKARYDTEPEETAEVTPPMADLGAIGAAVTEAASEATRAAGEAARAVGEAMRSMDFSGIGTRLSDESIKIVGSGSVSGNPVRTREFKAAGSAKVQGSLEAEVARVAGSCSFEGDVTVEEFRCAGSARIAGRLKAEEIEASGSLQVEGDVEGEEFSSSGSLQVRGKVVAEEFRSSGAVRIDGGLKAEEVTIDLGGSSKISTIEAEEIRVKATGGFFRLRGDLTAERIEGEEVELEATNAAFVKGDEVRIGPHCRIDVVEARDLVVHQSSEVRERRAQSVREEQGHREHAEHPE
ncbi:MAG TPA: polymer-forming cytoskeletal protein [Thermoplasmata archaeon]|nr:polymer-forming cytoskeletal protein [Thermoplasmata archaeon]